MQTIFTCFIILVFCLGTLPAPGQDDPATTADRILEGGNIIVEILKIVEKNNAGNSRDKSGKNPDCAVKNFTNICFINKSDDPISVELIQKTEGKKHELIICKDGKECCYQICPGVYTYSLWRSEDQEEKPFRKGEMLLEVCQDVEFKIK